MASQKDYYDILGIRRNASEEEIERAYRKLARSYHGDLHHYRFREISEAYEILSNRDRRERYDRLRHEVCSSPLWDYDNAEAEDEEDLSFEGFEDVVSRPAYDDPGAVPLSVLRGRDVRCFVTIKFREAISGTLKQVQIAKEISCAACSGRGCNPEGVQKVCLECGGAGQIQIGLPPAAFLQTCPRCAGRGKITLESCSACSGKGIVLEEEDFIIDIPPGVHRGCRFFFQGKGLTGRRGGPSGDLVVELEIDPDPVFQRKGYDLFVEVPLNFWEAALGEEIEIPTLTGSVAVKIPSGTQSGQELRLAGKGVPFFGGGGGGDQVITCRVSIPEIADPRSKEILEELRRLHPPRSRTLGKTESAS
jgi:molecular chaperone DnaJ